MSFHAAPISFAIASVRSRRRASWRSAGGSVSFMGMRRKHPGRRAQRSPRAARPSRPGHHRCLCVFGAHDRRNVHSDRRSAHIGFRSAHRGPRRAHRVNRSADLVNRSRHRAPRRAHRGPRRGHRAPRRPHRAPRDPHHATRRASSATPWATVDLAVLTSHAWPIAGPPGSSAPRASRESSGSQNMARARSTTARRRSTR